MPRELPLHREDFESLIPHAGAMCMLARVIGVDAQSIHCEADGHRDPLNPLRTGGALAITAGIEYAAQAVALHAALQRDDGGAVSNGSLAVLSDVKWTANRLDDIAGPLAVRATLLAGTSAGRQYSFEVGARDGAPVLSGVLIIALS